MLLTEPELNSLLKSNARTSNGILLFGTDADGISAMQASVTTRFGGDEEPLRLQAAALRHDPALLSDAFYALSLLGGRRVIVVEGCEENHLKSLSPIIEEAREGNFVILSSGSLTKTSKLRMLATQAKRFHA